MPIDLFVETAFDNGSPCDWAVAEDGALELILELHSEWAAGLDRPPLHTDWMAMGAGFAALLPEYFARTRSDQPR
jgi:hypothetical protein